MMIIAIPPLSDDKVPSDRCTFSTSGLPTSDCSSVILARPPVRFSHGSFLNSESSC